MRLKTTAVRTLAVALLVGSVLLGGTGVVVAGASPSQQGQRTYSASLYTQAEYQTQWIPGGVTPTHTITIQGGAAGRMWQVYQITNVGTTALSGAIATIQVFDVTGCSDSACLASVQLLNSNGVFTGGSPGTEVQDLGTIDPGSSSDHVLNLRYDSSVTGFSIRFLVWYLP